MNLLGVGILGLLAAMALALVRGAKGPTIFDRVLALNTFGTFTVLFICLHGFWAGRPDFLDLALVYALMNFIGTLAVLKFVQQRHLGAAPTEPE